MKNVIIGTAGHIDHGKTTLVRALTGRDTDTLEEEKRRGISINLGFTYFDLPSGKRAGIVDVPGHERFIKNMIAGACGIDIVLLVVAATEGIKPQTLEHADIIRFLGIKEGLIVMTHHDAADETMRELVADDMSDRLKGTFFEDKEIIMVDSISGYGMESLVKKIDELSEKTEQKQINTVPRLNIDRVFTVKGFGAVVTGTLTEGKVSLEDELCVHHCDSGRITAVKVKNIQIHDKKVPSAYAGQRTALNLSGVKAAELTRGDVLAAEGTIMLTSVADAHFTLTHNTKVNLKMWDRLRIYTGTRELFARFVPLSKPEDEKILPGESGFCQLRFEKSVFIKKGDPFVIRRYSPMETIGCGVILDSAPIKRRRADADVLNALSVKSEGSEASITEEFLRNTNEALTVKRLSALSARSEKQTEESLRELIGENAVVNINGFYFHINTIEDFRIKMMEITAGFHAKHRLKPGILKEELRTKASLPVKPKEFDALLRMFCADNTLAVSENTVSISGFKPEYTASQSKIYDKIEKAYLDAGFMPPPKSQLAGDKAALEVFDSMVKSTLIPLDESNFLHVKYMEAAKEMIRNHLSTEKTLSLAEFRDITHSSRKYCLLILEYLDNHRFTRRDGENRVLH